MIKIIVDIILGFIATIAGVVFAFLYIKSQESGHNLFFLVPTFPLVFIGVKLLFRATKLIEAGEKIPDPLEKLAQSHKASLVDKNNQILEDWKKTTENEAKLKMLQLKADSEEESTN